MGNLLEVKKVVKEFSIGGIFRKEKVTAVEEFSLEISDDEQTVITLAGESGSGKTTIINLLLGFIKPTSGQILYRGKDIWKLNGEEWRRYKMEVQAVFQDPYDSFNPFYKISHAILEPIKKFKLANDIKESYKITGKALNEVGLDADEVLGKYPHELSGGQRQRVMLARAFVLRPKILLADEPVSMIDVSIRADILKIIQKLQSEIDMSCLYITHDFSNAFCISDKIIILCLGSVMEQGDFETIIQAPKHPYVEALIRSIPIPNPKFRWKEKIKLQDIEITRFEKIAGCKYFNRCPDAKPICKDEKPPLIDLGKRHMVACHKYKSLHKSEFKR